MPTILVVDDSEVDRRLAGGLAESSLDARVVYTADGREAISQIIQHQPDIVLTDLQMPNMDGLQLVSCIRDDFPLLPVVLMTAKGSEETASRALKQGAAGYVPKKRLAEDLPETLLRVLIAAREDRGHSQLMHHMDAGQLRFSFHNSLEVISSLASHLQQMLRCLPLGDETERLRVGIALEEAMRNAYYHGNLEVSSAIDTVDHAAYDQLAEQRQYEEPYGDRKIHVQANIDRSQAKFSIRDEGSGFDTSSVHAAIEISDADEGAGRGVILMRTIMDDVKYNETGNEVTMIKYRASETIEDDLQDGELDQAD